MPVDAGEMFAEQVIDGVRGIGDIVDDHYAAAHLHRRFHRIREAAARGPGFVAVRIVKVAHDQAVYHDLNRVHLIPFQVDVFRHVAHLAIDADAHKPGLLDIFQYLFVASLAVFNDRGEYLDARSVCPLFDLFHDLLRRLCFDSFPANRAVGDADAGIEQAQIVVNLGDGAHRRARVVADTLLVNRDRGGQPFDLIDVRLIHLAQELAGVGGQRLDITALAFGKDRIEGERTLAAAAQPGDDDELITGDRHINVLQVVRACAAHNNLVLRHTYLNFF